MAKPNYKVTKTDGDTGKKTTVGRHTTAEAAAAARLTKRSKEQLGGSNSFGVSEIRHRS